MESPGTGNPGMRRHIRVAVGFALAFLAIWGFLAAVGPARVAAQLRAADPRVLGLGFLSVVVALGCWSEAVRRLLASVGQPVAGSKYRRAYLAGEFLKQVIPFGQSAGPALLAYTVSRTADTSYEGTLAATSVFAFLNVTASLVLAVGGLGLLVVTDRGPGGALLRSALLAVSVIAAVLVGVLVLTLYRRALLEAVVVRLASLVRVTVGRFFPRVEAALAPAAVRALLETYTVALDRLRGERRRVLAAAALACAGWTFFLLPMYTSFLALGEPVPFTLVVFVVPVVTLFNVVPLPGGLGGFEVAMASVFAVLGVVPFATATAAVFLFRLSNYWFLVILGGLAAVSVSIGVNDPPPVVPVEEEV